jgi:hypothetical protein
VTFVGLRILSGIFSEDLAGINNEDYEYEGDD